MDNLGLKFEVNNLGIIDMSWTNIIEPTLDKYWTSTQNMQCVSITPWSISQGIFLNVVFLYFSTFREYVEHDHIANVEGEQDKTVFNPLEMSSNDENMGIIKELNIPRVVYKMLMITLGKSLLRRKRMMMDEENKSFDRIYDNDLEYLYMKIAHLSKIKIKKYSKDICVHFI